MDALWTIQNGTENVDGFKKKIQKKRSPLKPQDTQDYGLCLPSLNTIEINKMWDIKMETTNAHWALGLIKKRQCMAQYSMSIIRRFLLKLKKTEKVAKALKKDLLDLYGINHCFAFNRFINVFFCTTMFPLISKLLSSVHRPHRTHNNSIISSDKRANPSNETLSLIFYLH